MGWGGAMSGGMMGRVLRDDGRVVGGTVAIYMHCDCDTIGGEIEMRLGWD